MNELTLCIVNEGSDYQWRLEIARKPSAHARFYYWADRVRQEAEALAHAFEETYTVEQMARAVAELDAYYQQHIKEM